MKMLDKEHFEQVLGDACSQVFEGKGEERHGHGGKFENQPWKLITDNVGTGFVVGQAMKKLMELKTFSSSSIDEKLRPKEYAAWRREALGAIVYVAMAIMYRDKLNNNRQDQETAEKK
jgi:hypothetical protein